VAIKAHGGVDALELMSVAVPEPGPGEVLVKLSFAGVNFVDVYMRRGDYARSARHGGELPMILGREAAGEVAKVGSGVTGWKPGDRVAWCITQGTYAEYALAPAWRLVPVPFDVPLDVACALQLQGATAHFLSTSAFPIQAGDVVLVHSAAGGVGQLLVQIAKSTGATVIATVGTDAKAQIAKARGADHVVVYTREDFRDKVREVTGGAGCHAVYDAVGKDTIAMSLAACRRRGVVVLYGGASGAVEAVSPQLLAEAGSLFLTRPHLGDYMQDAAEVQLRAGEVMTAWRSGQLKVAIDRVFPLEGAREAHHMLEGRQTTGKLILKCVA
jgi:NADPH2:quinone reductase